MSGARRWLRQARAAVESQLARTDTNGEWVQYGPNLKMRYVGERVVALRVRVTLAMDCVAAAAWLGYPAGKGRGFPLRRKDSCEWPGISERHRLEAGVSGRLKGVWFDLLTRPGARPARPGSPRGE